MPSKPEIEIYDDWITDPSPIVIAGPCSAETEEQVMNTACALSDAGVKIFRAGIWKPRTKPGCFEGVGSRGLEWLGKVKQTTGMLTATEVANRVHVNKALEAGVDILWIGARTSSNPFAVQEIADALTEAQIDVPVLVKNPLNPDLELWIGAITRIYNAGIRRLGAIHRGFGLYGSGKYRNTPLWRVPIELKRRIPGLPIIIDPSHMGGARELVAPLCQEAMDMRFSGLMVETHCNPDEAWSDSMQQITPAQLEEILTTLVVRGSSDVTEDLSTMRREIDEVDDELMALLGKRMEIARRIGEYKREHLMPVVQESRYDDLIRNRISQAESLGISDSFIRSVLQSIHEESVRQQIDVINLLNKP